MKRKRTSSLGVGAALAVLAFPTAAGAQKAFAASGAVRAEGSSPAPVGVIVAPVESGTDSVRTILQRDFDFSDRLAPVVLDNSFFAWLRPGTMTAPAASDYQSLARTKARALVIPRFEAAGLRVAYHDLRTGRMAQESFFPLPVVPALRVAELRDSVIKAHAAREVQTQAAISRTIFVRDSLEAAARGKQDRDASKRNAIQAARNSLMVATVAEEARLRNRLSRDLAERFAAVPMVISRDSASRDSLAYVRRMAIHSVSDAVTQWITGQRGYAQSRVVYVQDGTLRIVDSDGANDRILTATGHALSPSWHPDGNRVVYSDFTDAGTQIAQVDVWSRRVDMVKSTPRGLNMTPAYTPNGHQIVYSSGGEGPAELMVANADTSFPARRLSRVAQESSSPTFSPDGGRVAYISPRRWQGTGENSRFTPQIFTMNADGTGEMQLTPSAAGVRTYRTSPDWSPDGTRLAYMQQHGDFQLWTIGITDRKMKKLTSRGENEDPSWSPDSRHLAFTSNRGGSKEIWVLDSQSGRYRQLTFRGGGARLAAWSRVFDVGAAGPSHVPVTTLAAQGQQ